ncbi:neural cell adhesion molecule 2-like isoform X1, partial [Vespula squamosa]
ITWIRRKDKQLLTLGKLTYSIDTRFVVLQDKPNWNLLIKNVKQEDAGIYECHIQTEPVRQQLIRLNVTDAYSVIPGSPDLHVKQGSNLRLECRLMAFAETPSFIFWYRDDRMINYDNEPGVKIEATKNGSVLLVGKVRLSHGANYTCLPSNARPTYIMIHVIEEDIKKEKKNRKRTEKEKEERLEQKENSTIFNPLFYNMILHWYDLIRLITEEENPAAMHDSGDRRSSTSNTRNNVGYVYFLIIFSLGAFEFIFSKNDILTT